MGGGHGKGRVGWGGGLGRGGGGWGEGVGDSSVALTQISIEYMLSEYAC